MPPATHCSDASWLRRWRPAPAPVVTASSQIGNRSRVPGALPGSAALCCELIAVTPRCGDVDKGGTRRVRTVLGLSKTSTSIGWVLVDGRDAAAEPLDHDAFDITDASTAAPAATARRVRDIATASGFTVDSVHVTSSGNVSSLRDALTECGFDDVISVPLTEATRAWGRDTGYANAMEKTAICVFGQDSAAVSTIDVRSGAIQRATTTVTEDFATFTSWLNFAMAADGSQPDALYL